MHRDVEFFELRIGRWEARGEARHLTGDGEVAFEVGGGDSEDMGEVIERAIGSFVTGEERFGGREWRC